MDFDINWKYVNPMNWGKEEENRNKDKASGAVGQMKQNAQELKANQPVFNDVNYQQMQGDYNVTSEVMDNKDEQMARQKQLSQLQALEDLQKGGGLTMQDRANWQKYQTDAASADRGRREAILQGAQARGMANSGNQLLAQLQSSQDSTNLASQQGANLAGLAQQRALDAMAQSSQIAGNMRAQEMQRAQQLDAMKKFNTENLMNKDRFNIEQNTKAQQMKNELKQMSYDNQVKAVAEMAKALGMEAEFYAKMAQGSAAERGQVMGGVVDLIAAGVSGGSKK